MSNIIVSGAFGVLGSAIVATLLERGHRVAAVDMAAAPALPANVLAFPGVDGADEAAVEAAYIDAAARLGRIDGLNRRRSVAMVRRCCAIARATWLRRRQTPLNAASAAAANSRSTAESSGAPTTW